ncbi:MAG: energy-coupling factor transporter ATPase [Firmicutes bacterium]|nr:energy-coupling factor transporter ATPase [Bacillota bacterium]
MEQVIKIEKLTYTYNPKTPFAKKALDGVCLEIKKGDFIGIIGHTGCGKSTLVQHLNGLLKPQEGMLNVLGIDLFAKKIKKRYKELRSKVGMVFQYPEYQLFAENVFLDVAFGYKNFFNSKKNKLSKEQIEAAVRDAIMLVGLDYEIKNRSPFEISGGQKRRIAIAGVIVSKPEVLILDEPTAGLDPKGKAEVLKLIHSLHKTCCHTIIMISHDMDEIAKNCNRIALMENGKIIKVDSAQNIFSDVKKIKELNLDLPNCVKINLSLKEKGFDTGKNVFFEKELAELIAEKLKGEC